MGLLRRIFKKFLPKTFGSLHRASGSRSRSQAYTDVWDQDTARAVIDCIATHAAKGEVRHIRLNAEGQTDKVIYNSAYSKLLNQKPNPIMSAFEFKYRFFAQLEAKGTAVAYIKWDGIEPEMIFPVDYTNLDVRELTDGGYALEFYDYENVHTFLPLEDCIVVRKYYNKSLALGDNNGPLYAVLDMEHASDEGFIESLNTANKIRGIYKHKISMLDTADIEASQKKFEERFQKAAESGGIIGVDSMEDFTPINLTNYAANSSQMKETTNRIYSYFRTPEEIVQSRYSEHVGQAWYESVIEPLWMAFSQALTNACFTQREKDVGNRLMVSGGVMMGTSLQTRVNIISQTKEMGTLTINEQRELLGFPPIEGGDVRQVSLNYINAEDQSAYQNGNKGGGSGTPPSYKGDEGDNNSSDDGGNNND